MLKILWAFLLGPCAFASGTGVGNGGDIVFQYLESTREALLQTIHRDPVEASLCRTGDLNHEQREFCRNFFRAILPKIQTLNEVSSRTDFVLREEPLFVIGPDGKPQPVAARTALGPAGPIEFHYGTISFYSPKQILFLLAHEFVHKAEFRGAFVTDNDPIGPFPRGRRLIDAFATSVAELAGQYGTIGEEFLVFDFFSCSIYFHDAELTKISGFSPRRYLDKGDLQRFETSIGKRPLDLTLGARDSKKSMLYLEAHFSEDKGCLEQSGSQRQSNLQILRVDEDDHGNARPPVQVAFAELRGYNPTCKKRGEFSLGYGGFRFDCEFAGSFTQFGRARVGRTVNRP